MGKPDVFSRTYEDLDQALKNACIKYENAQVRKGLRVTRIALVYTPKEAPYFEIDVDEEVKVRGQKVKAVLPETIPTPCLHAATVCNGRGQLECILCDRLVDLCGDPGCPKCNLDLEPVPDTQRSSRYPAALDTTEDDEKDTPRKL